jgi:hypothetical protein
VVDGATATALQFLLDAGRMVWRAARGAT